MRCDQTTYACSKCIIMFVLVFSVFIISCIVIHLLSNTNDLYIFIASVNLIVKNCLFDLHVCQFMLHVDLCR